MTQSVKSLPVDDAIAVIDQWFMKQKPYAWKACPRQVKTALRDAACSEGWIEHRRAVTILQDAETSDRAGSANAGMAWIREEWFLRAQDKPGAAGIDAQSHHDDRTIPPIASSAPVDAKAEPREGVQAMHLDYV